MKRDTVLAEAFGGDAPTLAARCDAWMVASPRFAAFLEANRVKVRKKVRTAPGPEGQRDVLCELEVAYLLLQHRQIELAYEAYTAEKARGPDFSATLKGHIRFNVEVKRLRAGDRSLDARLTDAICAKLRQMPPSVPNLLWVVNEPSATEPAPNLALADLMKQVVLRAERKDEAILARSGYADTRAFFAQFVRLSGVLVSVADGARREVWANPQARHPLPPELRGWLVRASC